VLARCPSCRNTFSAERPGRQSCPVCGKPLVVPELPPAAGAAPLAPAPAERPGTPWERRQELGFWKAWGQTIQQALLEPAKLFESARLDRASAQLGFAIFTISLFWILAQLEGVLLRGQREQMRRILGGLSSTPQASRVVQRMLEVHEQANSPGWVLALALITPVSALVFLYLNAVVTHGVAAIMGQAKRGFAATFAACAYASAPMVLLVVPACGSIVALIWLIVLTSIGMKVAHGISTGAAAASVLAPYFVLCCAMFLAMGSLMMALQSGQP
jgi:hypothetical protein